MDMIMLQNEREKNANTKNRMAGKISRWTLSHQTKPKNTVKISQSSTKQEHQQQDAMEKIETKNETAEAVFL